MQHPCFSSPTSRKTPNKLATDWQLPNQKIHKQSRLSRQRNVAMVTAIGPHDMGSLPAISASGTLPEKGDRQHAFWERALSVAN